jgi:type III restriction enzyme
MSNPFFDQPILNSPYNYPIRHWELDDQGQPSQQIIEHRRRAQFITPIPKPKKRKGSTDQSLSGYGLIVGEKISDSRLISASSECY